MAQEKQAVLKYLQSVNRPYSANDILLNLHKEFGKTAIQKALDQLVEEKKVREKVYGKQKVYSVLQDSTQSSSNIQEELQDYEVKVTEQVEALKQLEQELKAAEEEYNVHKSTLTTAEAEQLKKELSHTVANLENKLTLLSENKMVVSAKERDEITKEFEKSSKEYKKRKRICTDIMNSILESYPKGKAALIEEIGIELDDDKIQSVL